MFHVKHQIQHRALFKEDLLLFREIFSSNQMELVAYVDLLLWWNKKVNLVSRDVSHETVLEHVRHSLLLSCLKEVQSATKIIDAGSGGGLPAIPLAICFPEKEVIANDIVTKKMMAVKQMGSAMKLKNLKTVGSSISAIELLPADLIITKHAFKVDELISLLGVSEWGKIVFLKGAAEAEVEINRVEFNLKGTIIHLEEVMKNEFYKGKAMVIVEKTV